MEKSVFIIIALFQSLFMFGQTKVMTLNIRYDTQNDGENWWGNRKSDVSHLLAFYHPDFIGIQEGLIHQLAFIDNELAEYQYIGVGRDDGKEKGEFTAIFFDTTKYELLTTTTFWLSPTPEKVSVGWDASMERIATYGAFVNKITSDTTHVFNAHFDHIGKESRRMSAQLILDKIAAFGLFEKQLIVMGDLNCEPIDDPIKALSGKLDDALEISEQPLYGPVGTFNGFDTDLILERRIDYIFTKQLNIKSYRHIDDRRPNNLYPSDHVPVLVELF